jgi:hypothetical protein
MGLTITRTGDWRANPGDRMSARVTVAFDSSYPTGGESLTPEDLALGEIDILLAGPHNGYVFEYDYTNKKLMVFQSAAVTPAGTISAPTFTGSAMTAHAHNFLVKGGTAAAGTDAINIKTAIIGKESATDDTALGVDSATKGGVIAGSAGTPAGTVSAPTFTGTAVAAAALTEVPAATNLSSLTGVVVYAIGRP